MAFTSDANYNPLTPPLRLTPSGWQTQLGGRVIDPTQATPAAPPPPPATLTQALASPQPSDQSPPPANIAPLPPIDDSLSKALMAEGNSGQPIHSPLELIGRLAQVWSGNAGEAAAQKKQATADQSRRLAIAQAVEAAGSDPNKLLQIAIQSGDPTAAAIAQRQLTAEHWTDLTPEQKVAAGYDPKVPVQVNSLTGEKRVVSSSLNVPFYGVPPTAAAPAPGAASNAPAAPTATGAPGTPAPTSVAQAAPPPTSGGSRFVTRPDGSQLDQATGKIIAAPVAGTALTPDQVAALGEGIVNGTQPPNTAGLYRNGAEVRAYIAQKHPEYNLANAQNDFTATQTHLKTMNNQQQTQMREAIPLVEDQLSRLQTMAQQWNAGQFPDINRVRQAITAHGLADPSDPAKSQAAQSLLQQMQGLIAEMTPELAKVYSGGNASTDAQLAHADQQLSTDWSLQTLTDMIKLAQTNLAVRKNTLATLGTGNTPNNPYDQTPAAPAAHANDPLGIR